MSPRQVYFLQQLKCRRIRDPQVVTLLFREPRWGVSTWQPCPHEGRYVSCLGCVTLDLLLQLCPLHPALPLVTLSGAYRRLQQRDKFGSVFVSRHPGNDRVAFLGSTKGNCGAWQPRCPGLRLLRPPGPALFHCKTASPWKHNAGLATDRCQITIDTGTNLVTCSFREWHLLYLLVQLIQSMRPWQALHGICKVSTWKSQAALMSALRGNCCSPSNQPSCNINRETLSLHSGLLFCAVAGYIMCQHIVQIMKMGSLNLYRR